MAKPARSVSDLASGPGGPLGRDLGIGVLSIVEWIIALPERRWNHSLFMGTLLPWGGWSPSPWMGSIERCQRLLGRALLVAWGRWRLDPTAVPG